MVSKVKFLVVSPQGTLKIVSLFVELKITQDD